MRSLSLPSSYLPPPAPCVQVVEPRWHELEAALRAARDVDAVLRAHAAFQDSVLKECLLTNPQLLKPLTKLMHTCLLFAEQMRRFAETRVTLGAAHERLEGDAQ